ncbi:MAG: ADP-glyceromanno-heptose 6-epimerase [Flavobacteriales bacterium]
MIVITGAYGFIGSCLVSYLNNKGISNLVLVDDFKKDRKKGNIEGKKYSSKVRRKHFGDWLEKYGPDIEMIFHLGARTDTAEHNEGLLNTLNLEFSQKVWNKCVEFDIPLIYASSAATYGIGDQGFDDSHDKISDLNPLNAYGWSKQKFDQWVLKQEKTPSFWVGLKFFNVYGPNEYHKDRMASVIWHTYNQIKETGKMKLFKSHKPEYKDGEQKRDFIYVKDVLKVCDFFRNNKKASLNGIYNLGTGKARTFNDLASAVFNALNKSPDIEYIPTPEDIRENYQYFTEADMKKLYNAGFNETFHTLEEGIDDYVRHYLVKGERVF